MPISENMGGARRHLAAALVVLAGCFPAGATVAGGLDSPVLQFHSYQPAAPRDTASVFAGLSFWQGDLDKARSAWKKGRFVAARKAFERAWKKKGSLVAAWYLGHIYRLGRGVRADDEKAFWYYRQVALAYDPDISSRKRLLMTVDALVRVAGYYRTGIGKAHKKRDPRRAWRLYSIAAGHGFPAAFYGLGVIALEGQGMKRRPRQAIGWLMKAARLRYAPAAARLGDLAMKGLKGHVRKDKVAALSWYMIAAALTTEARNPEIYDRLERLQATASEATRQRATRLAGDFVSKMKNGAIATAQ